MTSQNRQTNGGDGEPLLRTATSTTVKNLTGPTLAKNYRAAGVSGARAMWAGLTQRGHRGPVQAIAASNNGEFIVTGGVDYSVRVFQSDYTYEAYALVAVLDVPVPKHLEAPPERQGCIGHIFGVQPSTEWSKEEPHGVTALTMVTSRNKYKVETVANLPPKDTRAGPIVIGTGHGSVYFWDLTACLATGRAKHTGVTSFRELHKGKVNDICTLPLYPTDDSTGTEALVMTAGDDKDAVLLHLKLEEVNKPKFEEEHMQKNSSALLDVLFFGGGGVDTTEADKHSAAQADKMLKLVTLPSERRRISHDEPVLQVTSLTHQRGKNEVSLCALTAAGVYLYTDQGERVTILKINAKHVKMCYNEDPDKKDLFWSDVMCTEHLNLGTNAKMRSVVDKNGEVNLRSQSLVFVSGTSKAKDTTTTGWVAVWGIEDGVVGTRTNQGFLTYKQDAHTRNIEPLCCYRQEGVMLDVDQSGLSTTFAAQLKGDKSTVQVWNTEAVAPGRLVADPVGPTSVLICPGHEDMLMDLEHPSPICKLKVIEDEQGPALLTACESATAYIWDLEGNDKEQIYAELRSLTPLEIFLTPGLLIITALQFLSFAFVPESKWGDHTHRRAHHVQTFMVGSFAIKDDDTFWFEMYFVCAIIGVYQAIAFIGVPEKMDRLSRDAQSSREYMDEQQAKGCCRCWPASAWARCVSVVESIVYLVVQIFSTVGVVPMVKLLAGAIVCRSDPEKSGRWFLQAAPEIECFKGSHMQLMLVLLLIVPGYSFCLVPYAVVAGNSAYVPNKTLFEYRFWQEHNPWRLAAARKASNVHMAFMHMNPRYSFWTLFVELVGKVSMPLCAVWFADNALVQMSLVAFIGFVMWFSTLVFAPYIERKFSVLLQSLKLISFLAMATGLTTVILQDPHTHIPIMMLGGGTAIILLTLTIQLCTMTARRMPVHVFEALEDTPTDAEAK